MYRPVILTCSLLLSACASTPVPEHDPQQAWVEMFTRTGKLVMAERLDGKRLADGRYFQMPPGAHELVVRYDYEIQIPSLVMSQPSERLCYITLQYDDFKAGQRYRLEGRNLGLQAGARLFDEQGNKLAEDRKVNCLL